MAKPSRERVRRWRERKAKKGGRSLSTWLEPETVRMMDYLLNYYGETAAPLVARAIANLYEATGQDENGESGLASESQHLVAELDVSAEEPRPALGESTQPSDMAELEKIASVESTTDELDPLLLEIKTKLAEGTPAKNLLRTLLVQWIKSMKANDVSFEAMAERLNAAEIPTLSGKGQWEQGMIPTILLLSSF